MADQFEYCEGWAFNFQGEQSLDPVVNYTYPFAFFEFDDFAASGLWPENRTPILHGPISTGMDLFPSNDTWAESQALGLRCPNFCERNISGNLDVAISYNMSHKPGSQTNSSTTGMVTPSTVPESSLSPARIPCKSVPPLPRTSKRSRLEDFQSEFMGPEPVAAEKRRRRAYQTDRRREVGLIRQVGACVRCKIMKTPCDQESPCHRCVKLCEDPHLSQALCGRQKLLDIRLNSLQSDLWDRKHDDRWLRRNVTHLHGPRRMIELSLVNFCDISAFVKDQDCTWDGGHDGPWMAVAPLRIIVQEFEPGPGREIKHNLNVTLTDSKRTVLTTPSCNAIPTDSLPTLEQLSQWALDSTQFQRRSIFDEGLQGSFMSLARRYYECKIALPLRSLMQQAVRLSCLHGMWCSALPEPRHSRNEETKYASKAVHKQIAVIITPGIESLERNILGQLQALIFSQRGLGKENEVPIWICLWLLMLTYRRTIVHWSSRRNRDSYLELSQHMYNMLISTYSTIFRSSTPRWHNFLKAEVFEKFGRDPSVTERMGVIKTEMDDIERGYRNFRNPHDRLLRTLVFEHEKKLGEVAR